VNFATDAMRYSFITRPSRSAENINVQVAEMPLISM